MLLRSLFLRPSPRALVHLGQVQEQGWAAQQWKPQADRVEVQPEAAVALWQVLEALQEGLPGVQQRMPRLSQLCPFGQEHRPLQLQMA